jgi:hypothetical protein
MPQFDPRLFALGAGAITGGYLMSSNNDPLSIGGGAFIGASVGALGNFTVPSLENMLSVKNKELPMPNAATSSLRMTEEKEKILNQANTIISSGNSTFTGAFDPEKPFSTLSGTSFAEFSKTVNNTNNPMELRRIQLALAQQTDSIGVNVRDIKIAPTQMIRSLKIAEDSSEVERASAFKDYARNELGFAGREDALHSYYLNFKSLLNRPGEMELSDGNLKIAGLEPIPLYSTIGKRGNQIRAHVSGNNVFTSSAVNLYGEAKLNNTPTEATARALGLDMADKFNAKALDDMVKGLEGVMPDEAIGMLGNAGLSDEKLNEIIKLVKEKFQSHSSNLSGQYAEKKNLKDLIPTDYDRNLYGSTDITHTLNINNGRLNLDEPIKKISNYSKDGQKSQYQKLRQLIEQGNPVFTRAGVKPENNGLYRNSNYKENILNINTPSNRNAAAGSRGHAVTNDFDNSFEHLVNKLNLKTQYGSSIAVPRLAVDIDKFNKIAPDVLGSSNAIGDGFSLGNLEHFNDISIVENIKINAHANSEGNMLITNPVAKRLLTDKSATLQGLKDEVDSFDFDIADDSTHSSSMREMRDAFYAKPGDVAGYGNDGLPKVLKNTFDSYELIGVDLVSDGERTKTQMLYKGRMNAGAQSIIKMFGVDAKTQVGMIDSMNFGKAATIASMLNSGALSFNDQGKTLLHGTEITTPELKRAFNSPNLGDAFIQHIIKKGGTRLTNEQILDYNQSIMRHSMDVGMISDIKDSGQALHGKIAEDLIANTYTSGINTELHDVLKAHYDINRGSNIAINEDLAQALGKIGTTFSQEKAASSTVLAALMNQRQNFKSMFDNNDIVGVKKQAGILGIRVPKTPTFQNFSPLFDKYGASIVKTYSNPQDILTVLQDARQFSKLVPLFKNVNNQLPNMSYGIGSPDLRLEGVLGSATENKAMSWNSQLQLKYSGLTNEDLNLFGSHNSGKLSDFHAILSMQDVNTRSINGAINDLNGEAVRRAIGESSDTRRAALAAVGVKIDDSYGTYNLNFAGNRAGVKSIPIPLENTSVFASFPNGKTGEVANPKSIGTIGRIIDLDMKYKNARTIQEKKAIEEQLDANITLLTNTISKNHLFSETNSLPKTVMSRESNSSVYSNVAPIGGNIDRLTTALESEGESTSIGAVSSTGAISRLRAAGFDVKDHKDLMKNYVEHINIGGVKAMRLKTSNGNPFFSIMTREPSTGPGSTRMLQYILDNTIDKSSEALHISPKNDLYKLLQLGDYDGDHVPEFFPNYKKNVMPVFNKLSKVNKDLESVKGFAQYLGIKGKSTAVPSILDTFKLHSTKNYDEVLEEYTKTLFNSSEQAGISKRIAPAATKIAAGINNSIAEYGIQDVSRTNAARIMSHYLVENLIKTKHMDAVKFAQSGGVTDIERLSSLRSNFKNNNDVNGDYLKTLHSHLESMVDPAIKGTPHEAIHKQAIEDIIASERLHATSEKINTIEGSGLQGASYDDQLKGLREIATGKNANQTILNTVDSLETPLADRARMGYDILKTSIRRNIQDNKKLLSAGLGGLALTALMTQKAPDFSRSAANANPSRMAMEPARDHGADQEKTNRQYVDGYDLHKATSYILPPQQQKYATGIQANYIGNRNNFNNNIKTSVFGDNTPDTVRVELY